MFKYLCGKLWYPEHATSSSRMSGASSRAAEISSVPVRATGPEAKSGFTESVIDSILQFYVDLATLSD